MQLTAKAEGAGAPDPTTDSSDSSEYVGKHRPHRMALLHPRMRAGRLSGREADPQAK